MRFEGEDEGWRVRMRAGGVRMRAGGVRMRAGGEGRACP
jgi:hypothetical protein